MNTTLETNAILLDRSGDRANKRPGVVEPCYIEDDVTIENSTVGPHVAVERGTVIRNSTVKEAIIGANCRIENAKLHDSMLGERVTVSGVSGSFNLGSDAEARS